MAKHKIFLSREEAEDLIRKNKEYQQRLNEYNQLMFDYMNTGRQIENKSMSVAFYVNEKMIDKRYRNTKRALSVVQSASIHLRKKSGLIPFKDDFGNACYPEEKMKEMITEEWIQEALDRANEAAAKREVKGRKRVFQYNKGEAA